MKQLVGWLRANILVVLLLLVIVYLFLGRSGVSSLPSPMMERSAGFDTGLVQTSKMSYSPIIGGAPAPVTGVDRLVVRDTTLSLQVKSVQQSLGEIEKISVNAGGYLVDSSLNVPEGAASGTVTIRVPADKRVEVLTALKGLAVKTVSEYVQGTDVTDQYQNLDEQQRLLSITKSKFEQILQTAVRVQDILEVQRELTNLQAQIDSIKGQQKYLDQTAKLTKITIYLSTDEFALPYTPAQPWRPEVIFKQAVRSLVGSARAAGTAIIWIVVYSPLWGAALLVYWFFKRKLK